MSSRLLSLQPDEHMRWIYDPNHTDYHTDKARDLRGRRQRALESMPASERDQASFNDAMRARLPEKKS
jgi:hypothetical protein